MRKLFSEVIQPVSHAMENFPWGNQRMYAHYLAQTHYYVRHSTRLLATGAGRLPHEDEKLHHRFLKHGAEEKGHQDLVLKDLRRLGFELSDFPELPETSFLYQTQYYKTSYEDPASLFGYILALEGAAAVCVGGIYNRLIETYDKNCCVFLKVHGVVDQDHVEEAFELVEELSEERQNVIAVNLIQSCSAFANFFKGIQAAEASASRQVA